MVVMFPVPFAVYGWPLSGKGAAGGFAKKSRDLVIFYLARKNTLELLKPAKGATRMHATDPLPHRARITPAQLKHLNERVVWPWLKDALLDWAVMIAAMVQAGLWHNPAGYVLAILIIGNRQHGLALLGHD